MCVVVAVASFNTFTVLFLRNSGIAGCFVRLFRDHVLCRSLSGPNTSAWLVPNVLFLSFGGFVFCSIIFDFNYVLIFNFLLACTQP